MSPFMICQLVLIICGDYTIKKVGQWSCVTINVTFVFFVVDNSLVKSILLKKKKKSLVKSMYFKLQL